MPEFVTVAKVGDIPSGEGRAFEVDEQMVAVFNNDGEYLAIDDMCPHMGASLASGYFESADCTVTCPWHAWRFDTRAGTWCDNRRLKIDTYQVRIVADEIQVAPSDSVDEDNKNCPDATPSISSPVAQGSVDDAEISRSDSPNLQPTEDNDEK
jgi:nitrite reductase (NADH) small subunit